MRLRAQIIVDIAAGDFVEAAEHQKFLEQYLKSVRTRYPDAKLSMRERRERVADPGIPQSHEIKRLPVTKGSIK